MLEKSVTIMLCRCRRWCTLLHKAKSLALVFFLRGNCSLNFNFPLTIENNPEEFCSQLFKTNTQRHAAVGRRERTSSAPWRQEMNAGGAGSPLSEDSRSLGAPEPGLAAPSPMLTQSVQCWVLSDQPVQRLALQFIAEKLYIKKKPNS